MNNKRFQCRMCAQHKLNLTTEKQCLFFLSFCMEVRVFILYYTQTANDRSKFNVPRMESSSSSSYFFFFYFSKFFFLIFLFNFSLLLIWSFFSSSVFHFLFPLFLCGSWFCSSVTPTKRTIYVHTF